MKKIFNCVFAFFNKDLSTLYKEGSAANFDAVSSALSDFIQQVSSRLLVIYLVFLYLFCCMHGHSQGFKGYRETKRIFFCHSLRKWLLPRKRFIRKCHWEVHFGFSFLTA